MEVGQAVEVGVEVRVLKGHGGDSGGTLRDSCPLLWLACLEEARTERRCTWKASGRANSRALAAA